METDNFLTQMQPDEIREKILLGLEIAFKRLVEKKQKEGGELIFAKDGKIIRVKAKDITL